MTNLRVDESCLNLFAFSIQSLDQLIYAEDVAIQNGRSNGTNLYDILFVNMIMLITLQVCYIF